MPARRFPGNSGRYQVSWSHSSLAGCRSDIVFFDDLVIAQVFDDGVKLDCKPLPKSLEVSLLGPRRLVGMPTPELVLKYLEIDLLEDGLRLVRHLEFRYEIDGLLPLDIREHTRIIQSCGPVE